MCVCVNLFSSLSFQIDVFLATYFCKIGDVKDI